ncbi:MAG: TolC family protein [Bacteroidetes bacterium]|nr:MAG: TolC family protein [Bacteroidota bacterium]
MMHKLHKLRMKRVIFLLLVFLTTSFTIQSQDTVKYTLNEVIQIAQNQSPDAIMAKHRYRQSYWSFRSFKAEYLPSLKLDATIPDFNLSFEEKYSELDSTTNFVPLSNTNYKLELSLNQKIGFSGGQVFLSSSLRRLDNNLGESTTQYLTNAIDIGIIQPIFKYNPYHFDRKIRPILFEEAQRNYVETNENVAVKTVNYFFALLLAQIEVGIAYKNQSSYDTLYRIAVGRYNLGKIAENELLQLELNLLTAEASVEKAELSYKVSLSAFKSYLRLKDEVAVDLIPPVVTLHFDVSTSKAISMAKDNSSAGLEFQRRILEAEDNLYRAKREGRFDASIFASFGLTQSAGNMPDAYKNPYNSERVAVGLSVPILDWGVARGKIKVAESGLDLVETTIEQEKIDFDQNIFLNVMQFNMQKKQLQIAAKSDTVAQRRYDVTQKRYMIGKVNDVLELDKSQIDNDNAKMGYYRALQTYWRSYYQLRKLTLYDFQRDILISTSFDDLIK